MSPTKMSKKMMMSKMSREDVALARLGREGQRLYGEGKYKEALLVVEEIYNIDAARPENVLLLGAVHFELQNFAESIFYNQQCIRLEPKMAEAYNNLGNALGEVGDAEGAIQFLLKAIKLKPRYADAYNNLASAHMKLGQLGDAAETYEMCLVMDPTMVEAHCNLGTLHKARGKGDAARKCYLEAIRHKPDCAVAWSNLAGIFKDEGHLTTAVAYYRESIRLCPSLADAYSNLGAAMQAMGNAKEARQCYATAISLRPDLAVAHGNLGSCLLATGDAEGAVEASRRAVQLDSNYPDALNTLGTALRALSQLRAANPLHRECLAREAITSYRAALRLKPDHPHAYCNLGVAMRDRGMIREAIHCNVTAARLKPDLAAAHANLGALLREQGRVNQGLAHAHRAVDLDPGLVEARVNLSSAYRQLGNLDAAEEWSETAVKMAPSFGEAHAAKGAVLADRGEFDDAIASFERAIDLGGDDPDAFAALVVAKAAICRWDDRHAQLGRLARILEAQLASDAFDDDEFDAAIKFKVRAKARVTQDCRDMLRHEYGFSLEEEEEEEEDGAPRSKKRPRVYFGRLPCIHAFHALCLPHIVSPRDVQRIARRYAASARANVVLSRPPFVSYPRLRASHRLRIGYLSGNFTDHPVAHLVAPALKYHDRATCYVTCYALTAAAADSPSSSARCEWRSMVEAGCEGGAVDLPSDPAEAARAIHGDNVNVLISLDGHMAGGRNEVLALRPAPVQVGCAFGYPGTIGADYVDYLVADAHLRQESLDERFLVVPGMLNAHRDLFPLEEEEEENDDEKKEDRSASSRQRHGVPEEGFLFAYFGPLSHLDPIVFDKWMAILSRVPGSLLWLSRDPECAEPRLRSEARKRKIDDARIVFTEPIPKSLATIRRAGTAQLNLQPFAVHDADGALDCLWAGTPVLAHAGRAMPARTASALLLAAECPDLVAKTLETYVDMAVSLALDPERYENVKIRVRDARESVLFDTNRTVRNLEAGLAAALAKCLDEEEEEDHHHHHHRPENAA
ncbi:hypothetical protein CTAYLR_002971 [Chrysophaeum taylorii]|uniref:protein O-GlcNAc transferase n=1 Tax=Chrysophaeum taylorii TaxID=2483200 RepID=A0AAD7U516_9STRA|nr:hypothetical protein CTAYLR_002971 [Chrysophaeum taylorii]